MSNRIMKRVLMDVNSEDNKKRSTKRSLSTNTSQQVNKKQPGSTSKRYKALLTCVVCDGDAHGYNFDAISCESCKAFFRRNALRPIEKLKCRSTGHCSVKYNIKKRCKRCRLEKCIKSGMRKEWILSDKEKEEKRVKIEENRRLKQIHDTNQQRQQSPSQDFKIDGDLSIDFSSILNQTHLTDIDWSNIQSVQNSFTEAVRLNQIAGIAAYPFIQSIGSTSELFRVPLYISSMRLITFIKQLHEFQQLDKQEQIHLVKSNLLLICFFHSMYIYDPRNDCYHEPDTTDPLFSGKDWVQTLNKQFHMEMKQRRNELLDIFQMDNVVIKLFYIILLFSYQMSFNQSTQCVLLDIQPSNIFKVQDMFSDVLYRYCLQQYGPSEAPLLFARYTLKLMKLRELVDEMKSTIDNYVDVTELSPLIQSLLL